MFEPLFGPLSGAMSWISAVQIWMVGAMVGFLMLYAGYRVVQSAITGENRFNDDDEDD